MTNSTDSMDMRKDFDFSLFDDDERSMYNYYDNPW